MADDKGGGGGSSSGGDKGSSGGPSSGNGAQSGTSLAEGYAGPPSANTVGASVGGSSTPMFQLAGGNFSSGGGSAIGGGSGGTPTPLSANLSSPEGITSSGVTGGGTGVVAPVGGSGSPIDLTSLTNAGGVGGNAQGSAGVFADSGTTPLTADQMGGPAGGKAAPAAAAPAAGGEKSVLDSLGIKNPLGAAVGAAGLGYAAMQGQQQQKYSPELLAQAQRLDANGQAMMSYLQSGNLPPGLKASLDQATSSAKAKIVSNFASQGLNTDPTQNSALAQQLAQVEQQALISTAQMGQQLMQSGIQQSGLSSDLYKTLAGIDQTQTANIGKAIANFASSLGGGSGDGKAKGTISFG